MNLYHFFNCS